MTDRDRGSTLLLKNVLFAIAVPGTVAALVPYLILSRNGTVPIPGSGLRPALGLLLIVVGACVEARCIFDFGAVGRGTPVPFDPPKRLVVRGLYRYVRNPMYLSVLLILFGEAVLFASRALLSYAVSMAVVFHLFVRLYEERALRVKFGADYERYCHSVRRWLPGRPHES